MSPVQDDYRPGRRSILVDARGQSRYLLRAAELPAVAPAGLRRAVRLANRHRFWPQMLIFVSTLAGALILSLILQFILGIRVNGVLWWFLIAVFAGSGGSYGGRRMLKANAWRAYELCLANHTCPSCGYGIAGVPAAPVDQHVRHERGGARLLPGLAITTYFEDHPAAVHQCIVCPECAGAWPTLTAAPPAPSTAEARQTPASASSHPA